MIGLLSAVQSGAEGVALLVAALRLLRRLCLQTPDVLNAAVAGCLTGVLDPAATEEGLDRALAATEALAGVRLQEAEAKLATKALAKTLPTVLGCVGEARPLALLRRLEGLRMGDCGVLAWLAAQHKKVLARLLEALGAVLPRRDAASCLLLPALCECLCAGPAESQTRTLHAVFKAAKSNADAWAAFFAACCRDPDAESDAVCVARLLSGGLFALAQCEEHTQKRVVAVVQRLLEPVDVLGDLLAHADADCVRAVARFLVLLATAPLPDGSTLVPRAVVETLLVASVPCFPELLGSLLLLASSQALNSPQDLLAYLPLLPTLPRAARHDFYLLLKDLPFDAEAAVVNRVLDDALGDDDALAVAALALLAKLAKLAKQKDNVVFGVMQENHERIAGMTARWREMSKAALEPTRAKRLRVMR